MSRHFPGADLVISTTPHRALSAVRIERRCAVESIELADSERVLTIRGSHAGTPPTALTLRGSRVDTIGAVTVAGPDTFECRIPLHAAGWWGQDRAIPSGAYVLEVVYGRGAPRVLVASGALREVLPLHAHGRLANVRVSHAGLGLVTVSMAPPLAPSEVGKAGRASVTAVKRPTPVANGTLFAQSWFGKSFSDSPAALAEALRHDFTEVRVGVHDHSVEVPDFVTPTIVGSSAWWEALTSAQVVIDNSWIPSQFKRRPGQRVVQTWHGTPLKKLGFDRSQHEGRSSTPQSFKWGSSKWDLLVSPNSYSTEILRRAYTYDGTIAETGYPRNDVLAAPDGTRDRLRRSLGIGPGEIVVLYAPTFREGEADRSTFCDVAALDRRLGAGHRLLVRGHSATLRSARAIGGPHVIDVTTYPESAHMLAIADVLITDYSSVMFDFTATRRPIVFFTPDLDAYANDGRGVYFDLASVAPGPVVHDERHIADAVRYAWEHRHASSARYDAWTGRFNAHDDGGATERLATLVREWL